ncbi:MAG: hypothetical protein E7404_05095 [Ruminococcaceae bacterium]|nr:hypothetical protein [Oscillospiraceae bacterium]
MELYFTTEALSFLLTLIGGAIMGLISDIFRIIKKTSQKSVIFYTVNDIVMWIVLSFVAFETIFVVNSGMVRWYEIVALIFGFIIYTMTLSKYFVLLAEFLIKILKRIISIIVKMFSIIFLIVKKPFVIVYIWLKSQKNKFKIMKNKQKLNFEQINRIFRKN